MKKGRTGVLLIILGILCISASIVMLHSNPGMEGKNNKEADSVTENSEEDNTQVLDEKDSDNTITEEQKASVAAATTAIELQRDKPVHEINSDMYEWPYGNSRYANLREPDMVVYLSQNKEWFDELVEKFQQYEGRDISGLVGWDEEEQMVYYDHFLREDVVPIYDKYEDFFHDNIISLFHVDGDNVSFQSAQDDHEYLYYYYDENRNEKTDEFLDDTHIVHVAPHWWWQEPTDPH